MFDTPPAPIPPSARRRAQPSSGATTVFGRVARALRPALRHLAAALAAAALAAGSLLTPQPAAADTTYTVNVTFDNVKFTMINDGCYDVLCYATDKSLEVYGTVGAYTTAGASSAAGGLPYRIFGKWQPPSGCPYTLWDSNVGTTCPKEGTWVGTYDFTKVFLCGGSHYQTCSTGYSKNNTTIPLQVRPGEQFKVTVAMQDHDSWSANDNVCVGHVWFGPYSERELLAKKYVTDGQGQKINMGFNGDAECWVAFHLS
jgi:hypothetical protein